VIIEPMQLRDARAVAALHHSSLDGLLTQLGPAALRTYYAAVVGAPVATALVARDERGICGFVVGSTSPAALKQAVVKRRPLSVALAVVAGVVRRPAALWWLLQSGRGPDEGSYDPGTPELTYIAVRPDRRGGAVGALLVEAFANAMRAAGARGFELSVDDDNAAAARFYERVGFTRVGRYREFGTYHIRYRRDLDVTGGSSA
jgi:ribosomal protein S18 acetylase RimI-like enzyme